MLPHGNKFSDPRRPEKCRRGSLFISAPTTLHCAKIEAILQFPAPSLPCFCAAKNISKTEKICLTSGTRGAIIIKHSRDARVVELADSLDSGSSVHSGRAGSSPASRTTSPRTAYRSRRRFFLRNNCHLSPILSRLLPNPKRKASGLFLYGWR